MKTECEKSNIPQTIINELHYHSSGFSGNSTILGITFDPFGLCSLEEPQYTLIMFLEIPGVN